MNNASLLIHPVELSEAWINRMLKENIPTIALHPEGGRTAHLSLEGLIDMLSLPSYRALLDKAAENGLKIEYEMHAARYLLPAEEFEAHPDWFRMNKDGERVTDWNCCPSSDEALSYIAQRAAELAKKLYRSTDRYYFWLDDGKQSFCHCPKCAALSASDQQMRVLNRILLRLRQDNKNASLAYLAYCDTITPPEKIRPEEGIFLEYAPFLRDFHRPLCKDAESEPLRDLLAFFGQNTAKALDYWYDNSLFSKWKKPPVAFEVDKAVLQADFQYYTELGFCDIASFACFLGGDYEELYGPPDISDFGEAFRKY